MILIIVITVIFIFITLFFYKKYERSISPQDKPKPLEVISFMFGLLINIPLFVMAIYSLYVTRQTFLDAQISGPKQQAALDGSRRALESVISISNKQEKALNSVINILNSQKKALDSSSVSLKTVVATSVEQQKILTDNLKVSLNQLALIKEQQRIALLKPKLAFVIEEKQEDELIRKGIILTSNSSAVSEFDGYNTFNISLKIKNVGESVALNPLVLVASNDGILFRNGDDKQYLNTSLTSFNKYQGTSLPLFEDYRIYIHEYVKVSVPKTFTTFYMAFKVACYNVPNRKIVIRAQIKPE